MTNFLDKATGRLGSLVGMGRTRPAQGAKTPQPGAAPDKLRVNLSLELGRTELGALRYFLSRTGAPAPVTFAFDEKGLEALEAAARTGERQVAVTYSADLPEQLTAQLEWRDRVQSDMAEQCQVWARGLIAEVAKTYREQLRKDRAERFTAGGPAAAPGSVSLVVPPEAIKVNVTALVPPEAIRLAVTAHIPPTEERTRIERDEQGRITSAVKRVVASD